MNKIKEIFINLLRKSKRQRFIIRSEIVLDRIDHIIEYEKSNYAFAMFAETVTEDIKIEIVFKKAEQCSSNLPKIKINGVDCDNPAYDLITMLRRSIEVYQMDKV